MNPLEISRKDRFLLGLAEWLGPPLILGLGRSMRWVWKVHPETAEWLERGKPVIYAFWHGYILPLTYTHRRLGVYVLVSWNRDGEYITRVLGRMGFNTIRGSTSRGGHSALRRVISTGRSGRSLAFTPDGPRGPRHSVQDGVVVAAAMSGVPIVPLEAHPDRAWTLRSWDRFVIPKPFSRCGVVMDELLHVPRHAVDEMDTWKSRVAERIHAVGDQAAALAGGEEH